MRWRRLPDKQLSYYLSFFAKANNPYLTKERLNKTIKNLPDSFTIDELIDQLIFMEKIGEGYKQSETGKVISDEDVKAMIDKF